MPYGDIWHNRIMEYRTDGCAADYYKDKEESECKEKPLVWWRQKD